MVEYGKDSFNGLIEEVYVEQEDNPDFEDELEYMMYQYEAGQFSYMGFLEAFSQLLDIVIQNDYEISTTSFNRLDKLHCQDILPCYRLISMDVMDKYRNVLNDIDSKMIQISDVLFQKGVVYYQIRLNNYQKWNVHDSKLLKIDVFDKKVNLVLDWTIDVKQREYLFNHMKIYEFIDRYQESHN